MRVSVHAYACVRVHVCARVRACERELTDVGKGDADQFAVECVKNLSPIFVQTATNHVPCQVKVEDR